MSELVVPKGWKLKKLKEICSQITDGAHKTPTYVSEGIPFLRVKDIHSNEIDWKNTKKIPKLEHEELIKRCKPEKNDILYSKNGTIGLSKVIEWNNEFSIFVSLALLKPKKELLNSYFLKMFLDSPSAILQATKRSKTVSVTNLHLEEIREIQIPLPSLSIQKQIVAKLDHILGQLEEKKKQILTIIENNKQRIDFFEKNWLSYIIKNELEKDSQQKGWISSTIEEISEIKGSGTIPINENSGTELHFIRVSDMNINGNYPYILKTNSSITTSKKNILDRSIPPNSIIIPKRGGAILTNKKRITSKYSILDPNIMAIIPTDEIEPLFLYYFFLNTNLAQFVGGEVIPQLNKYDIAPLEIKYPKEHEIQKQIIQNIKSAEEKFQSQKQQFQNIRDSYESTIKYIEHMQSSILDAAFSGKLVQ